MEKEKQGTLDSSGLNISADYVKVDKIDSEGPNTTIDLNTGAIEWTDSGVRLKEMVTNPDHYNDNEIETFEMFILMFASQPHMIKGALLFNIFKYRDRAKLKGNPKEDSEKMLWYLDKLELLFPEDAHLYQIYHQSKEG